MDYRDWQALASLYATKNITHTAQSLFVSQPSLTTRIRRLENYYGVRLIIRKKKGIAFTPEGTQLAVHASKMLKEQRNIEENINNMKNRVVGTLRVGASNFFAKNKMPKILRLFKDSYPDVECQMVTGWSSDMHRMVLNQDVHVSFIKGDYTWLEEREQLYEEEVCVASPWPFEWEELPSMPRIDYYTDDYMKDIVNSWWYRNYKRNPFINIHVNQVDTCKEMVVNGLGYAVLANLVVNPYSKLYIKNITDSTGSPIKRKTWMYYHTESLELNIVKAFVEFVKKIDVKTL